VGQPSSRETAKAGCHARAVATTHQCRSRPWAVCQRVRAEVAAVVALLPGNSLPPLCFDRSRTWDRYLLRRRSTRPLSELRVRRRCDGTRRGRVDSAEEIGRLMIVTRRASPRSPTARTRPRRPGTDRSTDQFTVESATVSKKHSHDPALLREHRYIRHDLDGTPSGKGEPPAGVQSGTVKVSLADVARWQS
jgi:hypothetical protein